MKRDEVVLCSRLISFVVSKYVLVLVIRRRSTLLLYFTVDKVHYLIIFHHSRASTSTGRFLTLYEYEVLLTLSRRERSRPTVPVCPISNVQRHSLEGSCCHGSATTTINFPTQWRSTQATKRQQTATCYLHLLIESTIA